MILKKLTLRVPPLYLEMLQAWQDMECLRNFENNINQIIFNNKYFLIRGRMIYNENVFMRNIYQLHHCFDEHGIRPITYFQGLGLSSKEIVHVWRICDVVLKSGRYNWTMVRGTSYSDKENMRLKVFGHIC